MESRVEGWKRVQDTISEQNEAIEFRRAGIVRFDLFDWRMGTEKQADVNLATDLIRLSDIYDVALIVSGDQDYIPAVRVVKDKGKRVVNVSFRARDGNLLPGGARTLNRICDKSFMVPFADLNRFLNI